MVFLVNYEYRTSSNSLDNNRPYSGGSVGLGYSWILIHNLDYTYAIK